MNKLWVCPLLQQSDGNADDQSVPPHLNIIQHECVSTQTDPLIKVLMSPCFSPFVLRFPTVVVCASYCCVRQEYVYNSTVCVHWSVDACGDWSDIWGDERQMVKGDVWTQHRPRLGITANNEEKHMFYSPPNMQCFPFPGLSVCINTKVCCTCACVLLSIYDLITEAYSNMRRSVYMLRALSCGTSKCHDIKYLPATGISTLGPHVSLSLSSD